MSAQCLEAENGEVAYQLLSANQVDVIVMVYLCQAWAV